MKNLLTIILSLTISSVLYAQDMTYFSKSLIVKGDKEYAKFAYRSAVNFYLKGYKKDTSNLYVQQKIADCYRLLNNQGKAEIWYRRLIEKDQSESENYLYYAQALESNRKYEKSKRWYQKYEQHEPGENRITQKIKGLENLKTYLDDAKYYEIRRVRINSRTADFSPTFYDKGIVFVSGRNKSSVVKKTFNWDKSQYLDLFYAKIDDKHHFHPPTQFNKRLNTKYHEGPLVFYDDEKRVVFTRNNFHEGKEQRSKDDINKLKLFFAKNNDGNWTDIEPFEYNDNEYSLGHPAINEEGNFLIFTSDMPGSIGETDLWYSKLENSGWTTPKNFGSKINTEGNEMFPYFKEGVLYFASNGHAGLGGLDIYQVSFNETDGLGEVINLGAPLNSSKDDFGLITNDDGRSGYFSSNRSHELYDDLFHFNFNKPRITQIRGLVELQSDLSPIEQAQVILIDNVSNDTLEMVTTDRKGRFSFKVPWDKKFRLIAKKAHYEHINVPLINTYTHHQEEAIIMMNRLELIAKVIAIDNVTKELIPKPHIIVLDPIEGHSLTPREIDVDTFEYVIDPKIMYDVAGAKRHYFTEHIDQYSGDEKYGVVTWIVPLGEIELDKAIALEKIYYDVNKSAIRPDAALELNKLVTLLKENPDIKIELSSHTDSRGSDYYNKALSQRRAESAVAYIIKQGISTGRITAKGYGEELLVNDCANNVSCSQMEHQRNRRTEFKVVEY